MWPQENQYELLLAGSFITEEEKDVLAWGCNAKVNVPPRFKNNSKHKLTYKRATAMEVLVGFCSLRDAASPAERDMCSEGSWMHCWRSDVTLAVLWLCTVEFTRKEG